MGFPETPETPPGSAPVGADTPKLSSLFKHTCPCIRAPCGAWTNTTYVPDTRKRALFPFPHVGMFSFYFNPSITVLFIAHVSKDMNNMSLVSTLFFSLFFPLFFLLGFFSLHTLICMYTCSVDLNNSFIYSARLERRTSRKREERKGRKKRKTHRLTDWHTDRQTAEAIHTQIDRLIDR